MTSRDDPETDSSPLFNRMPVARRLGPIGELAGWAAAIAGLINLLRSALLHGQTTFIHDVLLWFLPIYYYFANSVLQHSLPLWDPFSQGGVSFLPHLLQLRMLDPSVFLNLWFGELFTKNLVTHANWDRVVRGLIAISGVYCLLRSWCRGVAVRLALIGILVFGSVMFGGFRQTAIADQLMTASWALVFLFMILEGDDSRLLPWVGMATMLGASLQAYYFTGAAIVFLFVMVGYLLFRRSRLIQIVRSRGVWVRATAFTAILLPMIAPNVAMLGVAKNYVIAARAEGGIHAGSVPLGGPTQIEPQSAEMHPIRMTYREVQYTGTFGTPWDFMQLLARDHHYLANETGTHDGASEGALYLGLLGYIGILIGLFSGRHHLKPIWATVLLGLTLVYIGPQGGLHWLLFQIYPPVWFVRHTVALTGFLAIGLLYFFVLGANTIVALAERPIQLGRFCALYRRVTVEAVVFFLLMTFGVQELLHGLLTVPVQLVGEPPTEIWYIAGLIGVTVLLARRMPATCSVIAVLTGQLICLYRLKHLGSDLDPTTTLKFVILPVLIVGVGLLTFPVKIKRFAIPAVLLIALICDMVGYASKLQVLWSAPRPEAAGLQIANRGFTPDLHAGRALNVVTPVYHPAWRQEVRQPELLAQHPVLFEPVYGPQPLRDQTHAIRVAPRYNSTVIPKNVFKAIRSNLSDSVLAGLMSIDTPMARIVWPDEVFRKKDAFAFLLGMPEADAVRLTRDGMILPPAAPSLRQGSAALGPRPDVRQIAFGPNKVTFATTTNRAAWLLYADRNEDGWTATVNGMPAPIFTADGLWKAVPLGVGPQEVEFFYRNIPVYYSLVLYWVAETIGFLWLLTLAILSLRRNRRPH